MFDPHDIVDPSDKFLENNVPRPTLAASLAALPRRKRLSWVMGGALYTFGTLVFVVSLISWEGTETTAIKTGQKELKQKSEEVVQASKVERASLVISLATASPAQDLAAPQVGSIDVDDFAASGPLAHQRPDSEAGEPAAADVSEQQTDPASQVPAPDAGAITETSEMSKERVRIATATTIYNQPAEVADVIGTALPGTEGILVSRQLDWVEIMDPATERTGWVRSSVLAPVIHEAGSSETALPEDDYFGVTERTSSATVEQKARAKAKNYRSKPRYGRRPLRRLRSALRRFR